MIKVGLPPVSYLSLIDPSKELSLRVKGIKDADVRENNKMVAGPSSNLFVTSMLQSSLGCCMLMFLQVDKMTPLMLMVISIVSNELSSLPCCL